MYGSVIMKIFITGVAGFLGSHLAYRLNRLGYEIGGCDNLVGGDMRNVHRAVDFHQMDCCNFDGMQGIMRGYDLVIHTAATAHEGLSVFSPSFITKNIFDASVTTISAAVSVGVKRFIYCSSMARYGDQQTPFTEDMPTKPVDPYGIAKVGAEDVLKVLAQTHGLDWNIVVPHNIIGPRQKYDDPYRNVVSIMINRNLSNKPAIIYGDGTQKRCFSYVDDCVNCIIKLAITPEIKSEVVNIGPDEETITINELAKIVAEECNFYGQPLYLPGRPREVKEATCSSDKARKMLDYKTTVPLRTAIKSTVEWIKILGPKEFVYGYPLEIVNANTPATWKDRLM